MTRGTERVETYRTEEEQVEALRGWWRENGRSTLFAVALAVAAGFGWEAWQEQRQRQAETASLRYEELLEAVQRPDDEVDGATVRHLAEELKKDFAGSTYARFAGLHLARVAATEGDYAAAERELRSVLTSNPAAEVRLLAELRLARVIAAGGDPRAGLEILKAAEAGAFEPAYAEARGDMYVQLGRRSAAIEAYEQALALEATAETDTSETLRLKLDSLNPIPAREVAPSGESGEPEPEEAGP